MRFRFRVWMPAVAVLLVLLSIAALLLYVLPAARIRLAGYAEDHAVAQAVTAANAVSSAEGSDLQRELELVADTGEGEVLVVDKQGDVEERAGDETLSPPPEDLLQRVAKGERIDEKVGEQRVAAAPVVRQDGIEG